MPTGSRVIDTGADNRFEVVVVKDLNPECEVPLDGGGTTKDVTFWSSDPTVDFCW